MNQALTEVHPQYLAGAPRSEVLLSMAALLAVVACALLALYQLSPPHAVPASAPPMEFSAGRAFKHVEVIAARPRPIGSAAHAETRDYLMRELTALGLAAEEQKTSGVSRRVGPTIVAASVENVVARLQGTAVGSAILLVAHYDSVPTGPGASDDASAVAALLETARALKAQPPLRNDVILLFTDAEEIGLLGAKAFVEEHPWAKDIAVVLNFEARGYTGQSMMFETSPGNRWLIDQFAAATEYPTATSLSYEVYKRLPNDTDFTIFKAHGFAGLNFAYLEGFTHYHTTLDNLDNIDQRSIQHDGSYALGLTRHFGNLDLNQSRRAASGAQTNAIYFNIFGSWFVHYSAKWALPLMLLALLLFGGVVYLGRRRRRVTLRGSAAASLAFLAALVLTPLLLWIVWWVFGLFQRALGLDEQTVAYHQNLCLLSFIVLAAATTAALVALLERKISAANMAIGGLLWWVMAAVLTSLALPGASYLFIWPLLFSLVALGFLFRAPRSEPVPTKHFILLTLCALPGVVLLTPTIYLLFTAMGFGAAAIVVVLAVLLTGLFIPQLRTFTAAHRWLLPGVAAVLGLVLLSAGSLMYGFNEKHRRSNNLFYALTADSNRAIWASADTRQDQWTAQFLTAGAKRGAITEYIPQQHSNIVSATAPVVNLPPPQIERLGDITTGDGLRSLKLRVRSPRQAQVLTVYLDADVTVLGALVNGKRLDNSSTGGPGGNAQARWRMSYYAPPPEGIELTLEVKSTALVKIRVLDQSYGLPNVPGVSPGARPTWLMPAAWQLYSDQTLVNKSYTF